ncbi:Inner membrane protein YgaZ [Fusobacterium sp. DD29]|nr:MULTISPECIES: AzlC family ABC transporter permease [unclassified Fusobacterium]MBR8700420.1 Inner membrane protein YgaZ [Fusobacterium sp. DD45]MBR8710169.1 Inner membrane protein YgaZ [Fusobacterium sp. DD28]MBR8748726.1 Inner membrane protein YgaZ [Fusobacterium sp. DD29]MBR8750730.1 Inner membrane protein YgaZ [Fusobacterium sp. DD26]MBR8760993.1 Inner membrane protein YgaZ [Fusobacterium sp. DD25]
MNKHFISGVRASIPACLGVIPVGISIGMLGVRAGLTEIEIILMSVMVMAGSSQLMAISMITQGAALSTIIIGTFFINLRHIVMSSSAMHRIKGTTLFKRLLGAFALCDESFAVFSLSDNSDYSFLLGSNTALYVSFVGSTVIGSFITSFLPQIVVDSFGIAFYAAFLGLLVPGIKHNVKLIMLVIITGLLNCIYQCFLPASWSVILSMISGALIGVWLVDDETLVAEKEA